MFGESAGLLLGIAIVVVDHCLFDAGCARTQTASAPTDAAPASALVTESVHQRFDALKSQCPRRNAGRCRRGAAEKAPGSAWSRRSIRRSRPILRRSLV